jgi:succinoglycan biosynthesis protein ExoM
MIDNKKIQNLNQDLISACICTYKRPDLLVRALDGIISQVADNKFSLEIVVVDNDGMRSAENVVRRYQQNNNDLKIIYDCEPEQNIALTRNRCIRNASGNFIAFIDDDESPVKNWLTDMYHCLKEYNSDSVLGPVLPEFPSGAPEWLKKSGLCDRPRNVTGSPITGKDLRAGNIFFQRKIFEKDDTWFDRSRGRTGGEDGEFISRQIKRGRKFIWCDEAVVFEIVPEERWHASYYLKRNFLIGTITGNKARQLKVFYFAIRPSLLLLIYFFLLLFSLLVGKHIWMKVLTKVCYNAGCVLSFLALTRSQYRQ